VGGYTMPTDTAKRSKQFLKPVERERKSRNDPQE
jgi:hypothetical protein